MALSHAILTALSHEPLSGYDLTKVFRTSTGFFWRATRQQIYVELRRLETGAMISGKRQEQHRYPDKIIWSITEKGDEELRAWLDTPSAPASIKEELLVKLYALEKADLSAFRSQLAERRAYHDERLIVFTTIEGRLAQGAATDIRTTGRLLGVRSGLRYEHAMLEWCDEAMAAIDRLLDHARTAVPAPPDA